MKKYLWILLSCSAAILSGVLITTSRSSLDRSMNGAYLLMPLLLGIGISIIYYAHKKRFILIIGCLAVYGVLMTGIEIILFRPWEKLFTPAGGTYTQYGLDALYPGFGVIILLCTIFLVFSANILFELGSHAFKKITTKHA